MAAGLLSRTIALGTAPKCASTNTHGAMTSRYRRVLIGVGVFLVLGGCSSSTPSQSSGRGSSTAAPGGAAGSGTTGTAAGTSGSVTPPIASGGAAGQTSQPAAGGGPAGLIDPTVTRDDCAVSTTYKREGCPCHASDTAACWTGPVADRNVGMCHDGLQICNGAADSEFAAWGPCMGEQKECGTDAGVPPPPDDECTCIPGSIIQCSEDCSVGIICSLTASKTCLPDGTWSVCREDVNVTLDLPGVQCRNMLHGCLDVLAVDGTAVKNTGEGELFIGDCSKQFKCGHAPPPKEPPPVEPPAMPY